MLIPAVIYIVWDVFFTAINVWGFNEIYYVQQLKIYNLPLEEVLFFFVVPYCCMFIYECIKKYFPKIQNQQWGKLVLNFIAYPLLIIAAISYQKYYTTFTFVGLALFIYGLTHAKKIVANFNASLFLISYTVCLIPFLIVNGFLTAIPVVKYNHYQNLNIRIHTIPVEDIFYGMLLIMMNVVIYEKLKSRKNK